MKINFIVGVGLVAVNLAACTGVFADPIELAPSPINSGPGGQGSATVDAWLAGVVTAYNSANLTMFPPPGDELFRINQGDAAQGGIPTFASGLTDIVLPENYDYIVLHWGGGNDNDTAYYTGNDPAGSTFDFANTIFLNKGNGTPLGLSSITVYDQRSTPTPDAGSALGLFGLGLTCLGLLRRKLS
jgi:hypothetical protein